MCRKIFSRKDPLDQISFAFISPGDLQFPAMRRLSIATAHAFLLVYATSSLPSFECVKRCFEEVREQRPDFQVRLIQIHSFMIYLVKFVEHSIILSTRKDFTEGSKILLDTNQKIILLDHQIMLLEP